MPFIATNLTVLSAANGFTLWHYRTTDSKDQVQAPDYFAPASTQMRAGDIVMVQAADATLLLPIRAGNLTGSGLTLDAAGAPPELRRSGNLPFKITLAAAVQTRAIILDPMPEAFEAGASIPIGASILGNIANLTFQLLNAAGAILASQNAAVSAGRATGLFAAQAPGGGYRIIARNAADTAHSTTSAPFAIGAPPRLLTEEGRALLLEAGGQLLLF
ncbi:MAG: hypothetical protein ACK5X9_08920 [Alphaproteobacteria bacterium]|jgi:hypothetical protein